MANHEATCPACGSALVVHVFAQMGGSVGENISLSSALSPEEQTAQHFLAAKAAAKAAADKAEAEATDAAKAVLAAAESRGATLDAAGKANAAKVAAAKAVLTKEEKASA